MTALNYSTITEAVRSQIELYAKTYADDYPNLGSLKVVAEREFEFTEGWVGIYLIRRTAPDERQSLSAGLKTRFNLEFEIKVWHYAAETSLAVEIRNEVLGMMETAIMSDRTFAGNVNACWITGGEFESGRDPSNNGKFWAGASVNLTCDCTSSI